MRYEYKNLKASNEQCRYNSTFFLNIQANTYSVLAVPESFLHGVALNFSYKAHKSAAYTAEAFQGRMHSRRLQRLNPNECFQTYSSQYVSGRGDLLIVTKNGIVIDYEPPIISLTYEYPSTFWQCSKLQMLCPSNHTNNASIADS